MTPTHTRLRWVSSKNAQSLQDFLERLGARVQIYQINWTGNKWFLWFVPGDNNADINSGDID